MADTPRFDELEELEIVRISEAVLLGTDDIDIPGFWLEEREEDAPPLSEDEELSLFQQVREMNVPQKVKLAIRGNREARSLLIRDANKSVSRLVLQNPRITDDEILGITKNRNSADELVRDISDNRDWVGVYAIRLALVENPKTPLPTALRLVASLNDRDVARIGKSKNVQTAVATQARRIGFQKRGR